MTTTTVPMARQEIVFGGQRFPSKKAVADHVRDILRTRPAETPLFDDGPFLHDFVLSLHREAAKKIGVGVAHFEIEERSFGNTSHRGFRIVRLDGTAESFGMNKCLAALYGRESAIRREVLNACRLAAMPSIRAWRTQQPEIVACPMTGRLLTRDDTFQTHVDHGWPNCFTPLVERFLAAEYLTWETFPIAESLLGDIGDDALRKRWIAFHDQHAQLRLVDGTWNCKAGDRKAIHDQSLTAQCDRFVMAAISITQELNIAHRERKRGELVRLSMPLIERRDKLNTQLEKGWKWLATHPDLENYDELEDHWLRWNEERQYIDQTLERALRGLRGDVS